MSASNGFVGLGYHRGELTAFGRQWLASDGRLLHLRYAIGRAWGALFGYDPESSRLPHRLARWANLSGY